MKLLSRTRLAAAAFLITASASPASAQVNTLVVAALKTPQGFDGDALRPGTQNVVTQVYEGLTTYAWIKDAKGQDVLDFSKPVGHLAESWTVSPDKTVYVFKLRPGVKSFFGNELTADDVVWGWEKSIAQKRTGQFIATVSSVAKVEKTARDEVRFTLSAPNEIFLHAITNYVPGIYDSTEVKKHATTEDPWALKWIELNTAGYGAYHLESVRQGEQAIFVANPNYFGPKPYYGRIVYREVPSAAARYQLLVSGQVQWIEELTHRQVAELKRNPRIKIVESQGTSMASARMNQRFKPFDDVRVRRAITLATDYEAINGAVFEGLGSRVGSIVPPVIPGHDASLKPVATDYDRARALLAEAGHPNGIDIALEYAAIEWWEEPVAIQMQQSLAKAGIRMTPTRITDADMRARSAINRRDLPFFTFRDLPFVLDPVYKMFLDAHTEGSSNRNGYNNAEFDAALRTAQSETDPAKRLALVTRAQELHAGEASWVYVVYPGHFEAMPQCMTGYVWWPDYHERWRGLRCQN